MNSPTDNDRQVGTTVAGFDVEAVVARGPLATVYRARRDNDRVALKIYRAQPSPGGEVERVDRERDIQVRVDSRAVARLVEHGTLDDGSPFLASEWIDGVLLEEVLADGPMAFETLVPVLDSLCEGLNAIHRAGVVHRDLKPSNIMLPKDDSAAAVILDFGHALVLGDERLTRSDLVLGSAAYMAPEQALGKPLDARADLYALGVVLYRALTGALPFEAESAVEVLNLHVTEPVVPPRLLNDAVDDAAQDLCLWLLAKEREQRVPSTHVLAITLGAIVNATQQSEERVA